MNCHTHVRPDADNSVHISPMLNPRCARSSGSNERQPMPSCSASLSACSVNPLRGTIKREFASRCSAFFAKASTASGPFFSTVILAFDDDQHRVPTELTVYYNVALAPMPETIREPLSLCVTLEPGPTFPAVLPQSFRALHRGPRVGDWLFGSDRRRPRLPPAAFTTATSLRRLDRGTRLPSVLCCVIDRRDWPPCRRQTGSPRECSA